MSHQLCVRNPTRFSHATICQLAYFLFLFIVGIGLETGTKERIVRDHLRIQYMLNGEKKDLSTSLSLDLVCPWLCRARVQGVSSFDLFLFV